MNSKKAIGIVGYGTFKQLDNFWERWLDESKSLFFLVGSPPTHIGIESITLNDGKIRTLSRSEKKVREVIYRGESINNMSLYSLNKGFHTALDHEFHVALFKSNFRKFECVYCEILSDMYSDLIREKIIDFINNFVEINKGEIFVMDKDQVAFNYASKGKGYDITNYPTLEILSNF